MKQSTLLGLILALSGFLAWFYLAIKPVNDGLSMMPFLFGGLMLAMGVRLILVPNLFREEEE